MEICLYNIQGFRGEYKYSIDDFITIINSKHNGVGKTTLYDCLRFLADSTKVDKEEQEFFLNLNEQEGLFSVSRKGVTHGFILQRGRPPVFYRQYEEEEIERQYENFVTAAQDIGILCINGAMINIFSKEVNLFSSSNTAQNYQLVKEITTHYQTEEMLHLLERSIEISKSDLNSLRAEKRGIDMQVETIPYYQYVDDLENLLNNDFYTDLETFLLQVEEKLDKLQEEEKYNFNSKVEKLFTVTELLEKIQPTDFNPPSIEPLNKLLKLQDLVERLQPSTELNLSIKVVEKLDKISEVLNNIVPNIDYTPLNLTPIERMQSVLDQLDKVITHEPVSVSSTLPTKLANICIKLGEMATLVNQENQFSKMAEQHKESLAKTRIQCPIREEVYLIEGKCCY